MQKGRERKNYLNGIKEKHKSEHVDSANKLFYGWFIISVKCSVCGLESTLKKVFILIFKFTLHC